MKRTILKVMAAVLFLGGIAFMSKVMAKDAPKICDSEWNVSYSGTIGVNPSITVTCSTGGDYKCPLCIL